MKAVTHRAVSARAELPPAAAGYYFATSQELIEEALRFHVEQRTGALGGVLREAADGARTPLEVGHRVAQALVSGRTGVTVAQYEVYLEAARNPAMHGVVVEAMAAFERTAVPLLTELGVRRPEQAVKAFVAVTDGFALHRMANPLPAEEEIELLFHAIVGLFLTYTTDWSTVEEQVALRGDSWRSGESPDD